MQLRASADGWRLMLAAFKHSAASWWSDQRNGVPWSQIRQMIAASHCVTATYNLLISAFFYEPGAHTFSGISCARKKEERAVSKGHGGSSYRRTWRCA